MKPHDDSNFLAALRRDRSSPPPEGARERVAARLELIAPGSAPRPEPSSGRPSGLRRIARGKLPTGSLVVPLVVTCVGGALLYALLRRGPSAPAAYVQTVAASTSAPAVVAPAPTPMIDLVVPPPVVPPPVVPAPSAPLGRAPSPVPRAGASQLDAERALLDAAHVALVANRFDSALRALERHALTYRRPMLGEERDALFVQALVRAGRYDEARARARAFRESSPGSIFSPAVDAALASIP